MINAIQVIGTGSKGNCCVIWDSKGNALLIDLGVRLNDTQRALRYDMSCVQGAVVTHIHGDHAKYIPDFQAVGIEVYGNSSVVEKYPKCGLLGGKNRIGDFTVIPINTPHDVPCCAFMIEDVDNIRYLYITDTSGMQWAFKRVDYLIIECNHDLETIVDNMYDNDYATRSQYGNHMSLDECCKYVGYIDKSCMKGILLWHASSSNLNKAKAVERVRDVSRMDNVMIAAKNVVMQTMDSNF